MSKGWSDEEIETAARMYAAGESFQRIGDELKKRADTVRHYIRSHSELFSEPLERKDILRGKASYKQIPRYMRRCHDCGRPTTDYRCQRCWARLRSRGGYAPKDEVSDADTITYGPIQ